MLRVTMKNLTLFCVVDVNRGYCHRCRGVRAEAAAEVVL